MQVTKQQLDLDMEQWADSQLGKECVKAVYFHPAYLYVEYIMRNAEMNESQAGIKIARRSINNPRYANDTTLMAESEEQLKRLFSPSLSAIRVVSSAYLRLLIFLPEILITPCASSSPAFLMMYSAYKLNKLGDNIRP